ncbi:MAG: hypothetical protein RMX65_032655 [Nostoc sp. DedQUE01]|nr:hypothetical protein [Nostoc sp. DedQUE01]
MGTNEQIRFTVLTEGKEWETLQRAEIIKSQRQSVIFDICDRIAINTNFILEMFRIKNVS